MRFYHCTDRIKQPDPLKIKQSGSDHPVIPLLFANTTALYSYGKNAYSFNLADETKIFNMSSKMYIGMRFDSNYRSGFFDALRRAGYDVAMKLQPEGDISLVVLNFSIIENWSLTNP